VNSTLRSTNRSSGQSASQRVGVDGGREVAVIGEPQLGRIAAEGILVGREASDFHATDCVHVT